MAKATRRTTKVRRKRSTRKAPKKACTCLQCACKKRRKVKSSAKKRKARSGVKKKVAKTKSLKRSRDSKSSLGELDGKVFRLSSLQKRFLSKAMQKAIIERQRRLGKTIVP